VELWDLFSLPEPPYCVRQIFEMQVMFNYHTHTEAVESDANIPEYKFLQTLASLTVLQHSRPRRTHSLTRQNNNNCISDDPIYAFQISIQVCRRTINQKSTFLIHYSFVICTLWSNSMCYNYFIIFHTSYTRYTTNFIKLFTLQNMILFL